MMPTSSNRAKLAHGKSSTTDVDAPTSPAGYRKAPGAPKRFKSPYILFSISKMEEYKRNFKNVQVTSFSSQISKEWKALSEDVKEMWKNVAEQDKQRYMAEKSMYTGPWLVRATTERSKKDPSAPKRPPSAFLNYCKIRRTELKLKNPTLKNTEISKLLGEEWKRAPTEVRKPHIDKELREREEYHKKTFVWRQQRRSEEDRTRQQRIAIAKSLISAKPMPVTLLSPTPSSQLVPTTALMNTPALSIMPSTHKSAHEVVKLSIQKKFPLHQQADRSPSPVSWNDMHLGYNGVEESLLPTFFPPPRTLSHEPPTTIHSGSPIMENMKAHQPDFPFAIAPDTRQVTETSVSEDDQTSYSVTNTRHDHSESSGTQNPLFPSIFDGDTAFDPPLLETGNGHTEPLG